MPMITTPVLAAATAGYGGDVLRLIADSGALVKFVLLILLGFSVLSWGVILERYRGLRRAEEQTARFLRALEEEKRLADMKERSSRFARSPLVPIFIAGFRELTSAIAENVNRFRGNPGMPDEARNRILERGARTDEQMDGQGLGLAMVREIVELYDGTLEIGDSALGGARIDVLLPGRSLPCRMTLPPTSLKAWTNYVVHVADLKKTRVGLVWTRFVAVGGKNVDGIDYTQTQFTFDRMISTSEAPGVLKAMKDVKEYASRPIMAAEYVSSKE